jgi:hypothetical protein
MLLLQKMRMTPGDCLLAVCLLSLALAGLTWSATGPVGARVVVSDGQKVLYTAPLDALVEVDLEGPLGPTRLRIDELGARIIDSPCPLKVCMGMGPARRAGDILACLPNQILVEVVGPGVEDVPYDMLSR